MEKKKEYKKPEVVKITTDFQQMIKNVTGGCPFVFVWNGKEYIKENNILPESENWVRREKVINDHYILQNEPRLKEGAVSLKLKEFEREISWLDKLELMMIRHPDNTRIGFTSDGKLASYNSNPLPALSCKDNKNRDSIRKVSNQNWIDPEYYYEGKAGDSLEFVFNKPDSNNLKLIIVDPKKDDWFDIAVKEYIGKGCPSIHIYLYFANEVKEIDVLHTREEFYPDIIDLTPYLPQIKGNLKIKLEFTAHHKVAFVGIDTTPPIPMKKRVYQLAQATHSELGDVTKVLREENNQFTRLIPGEEIELKFPAPEPASPGNRLSYVLVSKGYYIPVTKLMSLSKKAALV